MSFIVGLSYIMKVLLLLMVIDYVLGVIGAIVEKRLASNEIFKGGLRKGIVLLAVEDIIFQVSISYWIWWLCIMSMEILSIFEHVVASGVKLPQFLVRFVKLLNEEVDDVEIPIK